MGLGLRAGVRAARSGSPQALRCGQRVPAARPWVRVGFAGPGVPGGGAAGSAPPAPCPCPRRRCCCWAPPRWPASPWTSSSCSSTPSGCAAARARARSTWTPTAAAPPGASSSPRSSAGERGGAWRGRRGPLQGLPAGGEGPVAPHPALPCPSAGIAVGFYGNGETSDGIHRATYSLRHANRTVAGVQDRVSGRRDGRGLFPLLNPRLRVGRGAWEEAGAGQPRRTGARSSCSPAPPGAGVGHRGRPEPDCRAQPAEPGAAAGRASRAPARRPAAAGPAGHAAGLHSCHPVLEEPRRVAGGAGRAGGPLRLVQVCGPSPACATWPPLPQVKLYPPAVSQLAAPSA